MIEFEEKHEELNIPQEVSDRFEPKDVLFFDIETTGLKKETTSLYLIGCGYYNNGCLCTRFFFGEDTDDELTVLSSFFEFADNFKVLVHFNGTKFDLPYLKYKADKYSISNPLDSMESFDIYTSIKPLRYILFRESMRQKCVEDFLQIVRNDTYNGGELIPIYFEYSQTHSKELFNLLMMHNREDVIGMHRIFPILNYLELSKCSVSYKDNKILTYTDLSGKNRKEMLLMYSFDIALPQSFNVKSKDIYFKFDAANKLLTIRLPIYSGELLHFFDNYSDYYYLPFENTCIHKSIASAVDKSCRQKATKSTCYIVVTGDFLSQENIVFEETAGFDYKTRNNFFKVPEAFDKDMMDKYGHMLLTCMLKAKPRKKYNQQCTD